MVGEKRERERKRGKREVPSRPRVLAGGERGASGTRGRRWRRCREREHRRARVGAPENKWEHDRCAPLTIKMLPLYTKVQHVETCVGGCGRRWCGGMRTRLAHCRGCSARACPTPWCAEFKRAVLYELQTGLVQLRHASRCRVASCVRPRCKNIKPLWMHVTRCRALPCAQEGCYAARCLLTHYHRCRDAGCSKCKMVRADDVAAAALLLLARKA